MTSFLTKKHFNRQRLFRSVCVMLFFFFSNASYGQWVTLGDAASYPANGGGYQAGKELIVTEEARSQRSAIWKASKMSMYKNFEMRLKAYFGAKDGADGMAFVIHNDARGLATIGDTEQGGSAMGASNIKNSVIIEFDTYSNGEIGDPGEDHLAFYQNGRFERANRLSNNFIFNFNGKKDVEDGEWYDIHLVWNYAERLMTINMTNKDGKVQKFTHLFPKPNWTEIERLEKIVEDLGGIARFNELDKYLKKYDKEHNKERNLWSLTKDILKENVNDDLSFNEDFKVRKEKKYGNRWFPYNYENFKDSRLFDEKEKVEEYAIIDYCLNEIQELKDVTGGIESIFTRNGVWNGEVIVGFTASTGDSHNNHKFKELQAEYTNLRVKLDQTRTDNHYLGFVADGKLSNVAKVTIDPAYHKLKGVKFNIQTPLKDASGKLLEAIAYTGSTKFKLTKTGTTAWTLTSSTPFTISELEKAIDNTGYKSLEGNVISPEERKVQISILGEIIKADDKHNVGDQVESPVSIATLRPAYFIDLNGAEEEGLHYTSVVDGPVSLGTDALFLEASDVRNIASIEIRGFKNGDAVYINNEEVTNKVSNSNNCKLKYTGGILSIISTKNTLHANYEYLLKSIELDFSSKDRKLSTTMILKDGKKVQYSYSTYFPYRLDLDKPNASKTSYETLIEGQGETVKLTNDISFVNAIVPTIKAGKTRVVVHLDGNDIDNAFEGLLRGTVIKNEYEYAVNTEADWGVIKEQIDQKIFYTNRSVNPVHKTRTVSITVYEDKEVIATEKTTITTAYPRYRLAQKNDQWDYETNSLVDFTNKKIEDEVVLFDQKDFDLTLLGEDGEPSLKTLTIYTGRLNEKDQKMSILGLPYDLNYCDTKKEDRVEYGLAVSYLGRKKDTRSMGNYAIVAYEKGFQISKRNSAYISETEMYEVLSSIKLFLDTDKNKSEAELKAYLEAERILWVQGYYDDDFYTNVLLNSFTFHGFEQILPISLSSFGAERNAKEVTLNWTTLSETNNAYFEVQRSLDGVNYMSLGTEQGQGESQQEVHYSFVDHTAPNTQLYYRLVQVDFNEQYRYYTTVLESEGVGFEVTLLSENPVKGGTLTLGIQTSISQKSQLEVYDLLGKVIYREEFMLKKGMNLKEVSFKHGTKGIYILNIRTESGDTAQIRFVMEH